MDETAFQIETWTCVSGNARPLQRLWVAKCLLWAWKELFYVMELIKYIKCRWFYTFGLKVCGMTCFQKERKPLQQSSYAFFPFKDTADIAV